MLERLSLRNVGGISSCSLDLHGGFTVITGESGAGKSSIVRAIELAAGKRGQSALIRAGESEAQTEALFSTEQPIAGLDEKLQPAEGEFFAKRTIARSGRGHAMLQGMQVPLNLYGAAVSTLINIQSQFAQMELLDPKKQLAMLDSCGGTPLAALLRELAVIFEQARVKEHELVAVTNRRAEIERTYANASEVIPLTKKVDPVPGLEASLERDIAALNKQLSEKTKASQYMDILTGGLSERGLLDEVANVSGSLVDLLPQNERPEQNRLLQEAMQSLRDIAEAARKALGRSPSDINEEIDRLENRLGSLRKLRRLAGAKSEDELLSYCKGAVDGMAWLEKSFDRMNVLTQEARELRRKASQLALEIRGRRREAAKALEQRVNVLFKDLAMDGMGFAVRFAELPKLRREGADGVEFTLYTDKREGRVDKIASGGELSRLLLALQLSLPDEWLPQTLVFDEVEAGLGGKAAVLSGLKLQELSRKCQVVLVTHEASIAALGSDHYVVHRENGESIVTELTEEERVRELARMLSGNPDLPEAQRHAMKLLKGRNTIS